MHHQPPPSNVIVINQNAAEGNMSARHGLQTDEGIVHREAEGDREEGLRAVLTQFIEIRHG
jgi:hypothetical protein